MILYFSVANCRVECNYWGKVGDIFLNFVGSKGVSSEGLENVRKYVTILLHECVRISKSWEEFVKFRCSKLWFSGDSG